MDHYDIVSDMGSQRSIRALKWCHELDDHQGYITRGTKYEVAKC